MKYIFVEIEDILAYAKNGELYETEAVKNYQPRDEVIELINKLSEKYEIVLFSMAREDYRVAIEDFVSLNNINTDNVLLKDEYNKGTQTEVIRKMIKEFFDGDENKMFLKTHSVFTNNDRFVEWLMDEEYTVVQVG